MKKISIIFVMVVLCVLLSVTAYAAEGIWYSGDFYAMINTNLDSGTLYEGSFGSSMPVEAQKIQSKQAEFFAVNWMQETAEDGQAEPDLSNQAGYDLYDVYTDEETGDRFTVVSPVFDPLVPISSERDEIQYNLPVPDPDLYSVGSTKTIKDEDLTTKSMKCLYVGTYCTVWGSTSESSAVTISSTNAQSIGQTFDSYASRMISSFGSWFDVDGDSKVAILCHDIDSDYGTSVSTYTAGYFWAVNMINSSGKINGHNFGTHSNALAMDCIHVDTYPGMGTNFNNVSSCYATLIHEFQHLINFSYCIAGSNYISAMDTYLNEAFSMAAEHLICGSSTTSGRISYFNSESSYSPGWPLSYWDGALSNYSNSYLFGQYLRVRYAQLYGGDGSTFYKNILQSRTASNSDTLSIILNKLNTTSTELVKDFWSAVFLKKSSGRYGFNGESWANAINPLVVSSVQTAGSGIYNGGARFYPFDNYTIRIDNPTNLEIVCFQDGNVKTDNTIASGTCGSNLQWKLTGDGVFTVTGSGAMYDYEYEEAPWNWARDIIKQVNIGSGVTHIGDYAFVLSAVERVSLPSGLKTVGHGAFNKCYNLTSISFPRGLTSIGGYAFFATDISSITVPATVTSIGEGALNTGSLTSISVASGNSYYCVVDGVLFNSAKTRLLAFSGGSSRTSYTIPNTVKIIGAEAFYNSYLRTVTIPSSVETIETEAFCWSNLLTSLTIPDSVTEIGTAAFNFCESLTSVRLPQNITEIPAFAFYGAGTSALSVEIPSGVTSIGEYAFATAGICAVTIPKSVTNIYESAFSGCENLTDVYYGGTASNWSAINIAADNEPLLNATRHYGTSGGGSSTDTRLQYMTLDEQAVGSITLSDDSYPWVYNASKGRFESGNKAKSGTTSTLTIKLNLLKNSKITFDYGVSSENNYDKFYLTANGTTVVNGISNINNGSYEGTYPAGTYTFVFKYTKDGSLDKNDDCGWFDNFRVELDCNHETVKNAYVSLGNETHTVNKTCEDCGHVISTTTVSCTDSNHDLSCDYCGGDVACKHTAYTTRYTYNGNNVHTKKTTCDYCDHVMSTANEGCKDADSNTYCDLCGGKQVCLHTGGKYVSVVVNGNGTHQFRQLCSVCDESISAGTVTCTDRNGDKACDICLSAVGSSYSDSRLNYMGFGGGITNVSLSDTGYAWKYVSGSGRFESNNYRVDSSTSSMTISFKAANAGKIYFNYGVSSESSYDKLTIVYDGTTLVTASGEKNASMELNMAAGTHSLTFTYKKDVSVYNGSDTAWVKNLMFGCTHMGTSIEYVCNGSGSHTAYGHCDTCGTTLRNGTYACTDGNGDGICDQCLGGASASVSGTITHAARTLSLDGAIIINQYLYIDGFEGIDIEENGGVLFFKEAVSAEEATVENPKAINQEGLTYDAAKTRYGQASHGIAAKEYGDTIYIRGYVMDNNGNYHYGELMEYGVRTYCEGRLEKSSDQKLKNICVSLLHYGAAAQTYLNYHTENLANATIAAQYPNFAWSTSLLDDIAAVNTSIPSSSNVAVTNKSLSLEGTILINFYTKVYEVEAEKVEVLLWRGVEEKLTVRNVTETVEAEYDAEKDRYGVKSMGIFAKNYGETVFACAKVTDTDGNVHYSEIVGYSPEAYAASRLEKSSDAQLKELVKCMTIYGEQARIYFQ